MNAPRAAELPLDQIITDETWRPPTAGLIDSMARHGLLRPIDVRAREEGGYELLDGSRRLASARELGWPAIAALIEPPGEAPLARDLKALLLNTQRRNLQQLYVARHCRRLLAETGLAQADLARELRLGATTLSAMLRVLECPELAEAVARGELEFGAAKAMAVLPRADQIRLLEELAELARREEKLPSVRQVEELVRRCQGHLPTVAPAPERLTGVIEALCAQGLPLEIRTARGRSSQVKVALTLTEADQLRLEAILQEESAPAPPAGEPMNSSPRGDTPI